MNGKHARVDFPGVAFVAARFSEAGIGYGEESVVGGLEEGRGLAQAEQIAIEKDVSFVAEISERLEFVEGFSVALGLALFVGPNVGVAGGVDEVSLLAELS